MMNLFFSAPKHFVGQVNQLDVEFQPQPFAPAGKAVEEGGVVAFEPHGNDVALVLYAFGNEGLVPGEVFDFGALPAGDEPSGKDSHLSVAFVGFAQGVGLVLVLLAVFVDGQKIVGQRSMAMSRSLTTNLMLRLYFRPSTAMRATPSSPPSG